MQMKLRGLALVLALALFLPASALAAPISSIPGTWSSTATSGSDVEGLIAPAFWTGLSWDCATCGVGYVINAFGLSGLEYLNDGAGNPVGFRFDDDIISTTLISQMTAWTNGTFGRRADGAFTYDSGTGRVSNSWDDGEQYALFRLVGPETTRYFLGIEDILLTELYNDHDYNDYVVSFETRTAVPEPSTLLLLGTSLAALAMRKRAQTTVERRQTAI
jgi:hypothetical protein